MNNNLVFKALNQINILEGYSSKIKQRKFTFEEREGDELVQGRRVKINQAALTAKQRERRKCVFPLYLPAQHPHPKE